MIEDIILGLQPQLILSLQESLRIPSVYEDDDSNYPYGRAVNQALEHFLTTAEKLGFKVVNLAGKVGYIEYGVANEMIMIAGHVDVVPAGNNWQEEPFGGNLVGKRLYGRGAIDDKGPMFTCLYALVALRQASVKLKRRVRLVIGTNEEKGMDCLHYYVATGQEMPVAGFTPDGKFPVVNGEKGIIQANIKKQISPGTNGIQVSSLYGGTAFNMVPAEAEALLLGSDEELRLAKIQLEALNDEQLKAIINKDKSLSILASGVSAHASTPEQGDNAITRLILALAQLKGLDPTWQETCHQLGCKLLTGNNGRGIGIAMEDAASGKLSLNIGILRYTEGELLLTLDIRYPVTELGKEIITKLSQAPLFKEYDLSLQHQLDPVYFPPEHELIKSLAGAFTTITGEEMRYLSMGGGTYAKVIPNMVAFGPCLPEDAEADSLHKPDEFTTLSHLERNMRIYAQAISNLAN
ncbi:MAG: Sapep family Mn(2+)-dependent dipeptidase [Clostridia bacterium]